MIVQLYKTSVGHNLDIITYKQITKFHQSLSPYHYVELQQAPQLAAKSESRGEESEFNSCCQEQGVEGRRVSLTPGLKGRAQAKASQSNLSSSSIIISSIIRSSVSWPHTLMSFCSDRLLLLSPYFLITGLGVGMCLCVCACICACLCVFVCLCLKSYL